MIVFFDLPVETQANRRAYTKFRKFLLMDGFIMVQKSVYSKVVLNGASANTAKTRVRNNKPPEGTVQIMVITEKQFQNIEYIIGEGQKTVVDSQSRLVFL